MPKNNIVFQVNDLVFAKLRGYPPWPAKIIDVVNKKKYNVYFYGSGDYANILIKDLLPYSENKHIYVNNVSLKRQHFQAALDEIEAEILATNFVSPNKGVVKADDVGQNEVSTTAQDVSSIDEKKVFATIDVAMTQKRKYRQNSASVNKKMKFEIEESLLEIFEKIRVLLRKSTADVDMALFYLRKLEKLKVTSLMLKKNTECVENIRLLRRYVGNMKDWNYSEEEKLHFNEVSDQIRQIACKIFNKYKTLFAAPENVNFMDFFDNQVKIFQFRTKHLLDSEYAEIYEEPNPL